MRYLFGFLCVCALGVVPLVGCGDTTGDGGSGGDGGVGGMGGGGTDLCEGVDCDDGNDCTEDTCLDGTCENTPVADDTACGADAGTCQQGSCQVACTEQDIRNAIAAGGGPYTFDCGGPTTIEVPGDTVIDEDVILDGEGMLTIANAEFNILVTEPPEFGRPAVELRRLTFTGSQISNLFGSVVLRETAVLDSPRYGIQNGGRFTVIDSVISGASRAGFRNVNGRFCGDMTVIDRTVISGNQLGGIVNCGNMTVRNSLISNNSGDGGVIHTAGGVTSIVNSTVSGNDGDGIVICYFDLTTTNVTVTGNTGSAISTCAPAYAATVANTILDGACNGSVTSNGYNIESPGDTCGFDQANDLFDVTPAELNLGPLQDNGGPTETHALGAGSVAIDMIPEADCVDEGGEPLTTDQRGEPRPAGAESKCDVGSFEVQAGGQ